MNFLSEIDSWIAVHEEEMVNDIRKLVKIPSISQRREEPYIFGEECHRAAVCMRMTAERYGLKTEDCAGRCIRIQYGEGEKKVEIWNHLDVVPEGEGWIYEPYECQRVGDFLIGRGVSDNKGPAIAVLYAIRYLKEYDIKLHYSLNQVCGLSEETGMEDAVWYVSKYGSPDFALISDCRFPLCYGEKGRCQIKVLSKEVMEHIKVLYAGMVSNSVAESAELVLQHQSEELRMTAKGVAGHAAAPEKCVNPIGILAKQVEEREGLVLSKAEQKLFQFLNLACSDGYGEGLGIEYEDEVFGRMSCAGTVLRLEEGRVSLEFDLRYPPDMDIRRAADDLSREAHKYGMEVIAINVTEGYRQDLASPYISTLLSSYHQVCGEEGEPYVMGGNTYARFFKNAVGFGPGIPKDFSELQLPYGHGGGHACDEVQSVSSLCMAVKVYVTALWNLEKMIGGR